MMRTRMIMLVSVLVIAVVCGGNVQATAKTYYVSVSGDDSADGLAEKTAWRTIAHAAKVAVAGDTVKIKAGKYGPEQVVITNSGTEDKPIVFEGYGGAPVLDGGNGLETGIQVKGNYVVLRNFEVNKYETGVAVNDADHVTLEGISATYLGPRKGGFRGTGIGVWGCKHCVLRKCNVTDAGAQNFTLAASSHILMEHCASYGVTTNDAVDYYIRLDRSDDCIVRNCLAQNKHPLSKVHAGHGITLKNQNRRNKVINCVARGLGEAIGVAHFSNDNEFINCTVYSDGGQVRSGWCGAYFVRDGAERNRFVNCNAFGVKDGILLYDTDETPWKYRERKKGQSWQQGRPAAVPPAVQQDNVFENCIINVRDFAILFNNPYGKKTVSKNNMFRNCVFTGAKKMFYVKGAESGNVVTNSIIAGIKSAGYKNTVRFSYCDIWKGFRVSGQGNISKYPYFAAFAKGDYHLKSKTGRWDPKTKDFVKDTVNSPCIDAGDPKAEWKNEPKPNGGRVNIGAYGNTPEASKSTGSR